MLHRYTSRKKTWLRVLPLSQLRQAVLPYRIIDIGTFQLLVGMQVRVIHAELAIQYRYL